MIFSYENPEEPIQSQPTGTTMTGAPLRVSLYVCRANRQWVVLDGDGNYWVLPSSENPWDERQPFFPTEETELEPVPGHYKILIGLPH